MSWGGVVGRNVSLRLLLISTVRGEDLDDDDLGLAQERGEAQSTFDGWWGIVVGWMDVWLLVGWMFGCWLDGCLVVGRMDTTVD
jgi:hypothetical protein